MAIHSAFRGGEGGSGWDGATGDCGTGGTGASISGDSTLRDMACFFVGGEGGTYNPPLTHCADGTDLALAPGATRVGMAGPPRALLTERVAREGDVVAVEFFGQPGDAVLLSAAPGTRYRLAPQRRGVWLLDGSSHPPGSSAGPSGGPARALPEGAPSRKGTIGGAGTLATDLQLGTLPSGTESRVIYLQATMVDSVGEPVLTNLGALVVFDDAF